MKTDFDISPQTLGYIATQMGYKSADRYTSRCEFLFRNIPFSQKRFLDVGCGRGAFCLWAAIKGADYVLGIEPEASGSTSGASVGFRQAIKELDLGKRVFAEAVRLQDLQAPARLFDIAVLFNVVNHLDEDAVVRLAHDSAAVGKYVSILAHLRSLVIRDGYIIVADCGRSNFWNGLGLRSPIAPTIEWRKHQNPEVWVAVFARAGFVLHDLRWSSLYPWRRLTGNRLVQYLTTSHFVLRFRAN